MRKLGLAFLMVTALALGSATESAALSFSLNCIIAVSGCSPSATYGTVTPTDNGNNVDLTVSLVGGAQKILAVYLNYNDATFSNSSAFLLANKTVGVNENNNALPPYNDGKFDLQIPPTGNVNEFGTYSDTFSLASFKVTFRAGSAIATGRMSPPARSIQRALTCCVSPRGAKSPSSSPTPKFAPTRPPSKPGCGRSTSSEARLEA